MIHPNVTYEYVLKHYPHWGGYFLNQVDDRVHRQGGVIHTLRQYPLRYKRKGPLEKLTRLDPENQASVLAHLAKETGKFDFLFSIMETASFRRVNGENQLLINYQIIAYIR